ncbi:16S rRNA (guanine(527)-N(7))-methyltransferase RsmG [Prochlorococcus marinus]|uniref:16S rRNA (guanine(527)-N(7))-methyltransferase RsmG n=1 Tax=Prochlorococcus marinus TaxID=1219 RepID=UPI0022B4B676|nr:16S rRNA (guanine(527)-N(7))-methyltransferase RsmG [Prochlorococcus marinus]
MTISPKFWTPTHNIWNCLDWHPTKQQFEQFTKLQNLLREWNKNINLTRLIEDNDFWISQIIDSLWPIKNELKNHDKQLQIIDVGTGCGLPGLAIAIALPNSSITLVDSIYKKTHAVKEITKDLGLKSRVSIRTERIEVTGQSSQFRGNFDLAIARAVAQGAVLAEYLIPLLKPSGQAILYKGQWQESEKKELIEALAILKGKILSSEYFLLPEHQGKRHSIRLGSTHECPKKFPRSIGIPLKQPLNNQSTTNL